MRTTETASEHVRVEVEDGIGTIRVDRGKMNPLNIAVQDALREAAEIVSADPEVRTVIIYGGEVVFAAGADIKEMETMTYTDMVDRAAIIQECFKAVAHIPKPTIAAITGYALGAGCELALCADFRIVASDAKLGQPEILLGVIPGAGGSQRLARLVGVSRAKDLVYTGRMIDANEALAIGLVDDVCPAGSAHETAVARPRVATTRIDSRRASGRVRRSSSTVAGPVGRPSSPTATNTANRTASSTDSPATPPPRSSSDIDATSVGRDGSAQGVPVWAAWCSRLGSHGVNVRHPTARAATTASDARPRFRSPRRRASTPRPSRPRPAAPTSQSPQ